MSKIETFTIVIFLCALFSAHMGCAAIDGSETDGFDFGAGGQGEMDTDSSDESEPNTQLTGDTDNDCPVGDPYYECQFFFCRSPFIEVSGNCAGGSNLCCYAPPCPVDEPGYSCEKDFFACASDL